MKRLLCLLLPLCLLLSGCGRNRAAERYESFAAALRERQDLCFDAAVRAEFEDRRMDFALSYCDTEEGCTVTVLEPEELKGLKARLGPDGAELSYEGLVLDAGDLDEFGLSPMNALPLLAGTLRDGHLERAWQEDGLTVWELTADDEHSLSLWVDEDLTPRRAELYSQGRTAVYLDFTDWR